MVGPDHGSLCEHMNGKLHLAAVNIDIQGIMVGSHDHIAD